MHTRRSALSAAGLTGLALALPTPLRAATTYEIETLTASGTEPMRFSPNILKVPAGATVTFKPAELAHNSQTTPGMLPEGARPWRFVFGREGSVTLDRPGFYGYHCLAHRGLGMVGLIIVEGPGMRDNLEAAKAVRQVGKAAERWAEIWDRVEALI